MSTRRQLSWRARQGSQRLREGSRRAAVNCWGDFVNPQLVPLKITFFIIMGATQCVAPFTTLLLRALGLTVQETGFIFTIGPLIPVLAPLLAGIIADKVGNFRCILVFTVALSGLVTLFYLAIPPARTTPKYSATVSFSLTCDSDFVLTLNSARKDKEKCDFFNKTVILPSVEAKDCGYVCAESAVEYPAKLLKEIKRIKLLQSVNRTLYHMCKIQNTKENEKMPQKCFRKNLNKSRSYENMPKSFQIHNLLLPLSEMNRENPKIFVANYTMAPELARSLECTKGRVPKVISIPKITISEDGPEFSEKNAHVVCNFHCQVSVMHNQTCEKRPHSEVHDVTLSFWLFVTVNVLSKLFIGLTYTLFEVAVVAILKEFGYDYGLQRIYGSIGGMVFAPLSGFFIDHFGKGGHYTDYYVMFILYCALKLLCALLLVKVDLRFKVPARSICENMGNLFRNLEVLLLLSVVFISGMCYGFIENFLPWHLRDLGASNWFIGLLTTIASIAALPFLACSGIICKKFGNFQSIAFGLLCYSIRCIGYSLIVDYYWCAPFELLEGVTTGLLVTAAIIYGAQLSSKTNLATLQGVLATLHYGLGKSIGSLLGGYLMATLKAPFAFQVFSGIALISAFVYYIIGKLVILPRHAKDLRRRQEIMAMPIETISRREHKRRSKLFKEPGGDSDRVKEKPKKQRSPSPIPVTENVQVHMGENGALDETQMTDLPADDTMISLDESFVEDESKKKEDK
ncbi:major facilitator superfamily domain-containing protein 6-like [Homarus americanus]|uniref:Major facilitator superfamily domain-containing protein 6-like 4 n=1 Tax=Homarus americanus TaxID=6706 RepID=A0A8J5MLW3_HOMAM|nr:major facilitator superfamily domain-containing protein 6-like [Homarus americanus]XP_042204248.1 major facilitator superfamily domain-containing protein 6-like [Homarus americanus]XP_042204249.1 major facilitator superfamily domain-containing protein 6-like [Homarus americanus]XP_042204250.1 major facilitator superfamily domain-containing protein 6-like [Homarus americanus]XP_042204251.1 major facilitator superfamily domain-containing protein 6-like [Homarus americanus]XP_042204252.1 major